MTVALSILAIVGGLTVAFRSLREIVGQFWDEEFPGSRSRRGLGE